MKNNELISNFKNAAEKVSAIIHEAPEVEQALKITVELLTYKKPLVNLISTTSKAEKTKTLAAPNLSAVNYKSLQLLCKENHIELINQDIRKYPGGIDMGLTVMDFGIADTGTLILSSDSEETRLATMLCETHVAIIKKKQIHESVFSVADKLNKMITRPSSYTAFITGASRTADIERVLALGVHGPLELHIILTGE